MRCSGAFPNKFALTLCFTILAVWAEAQSSPTQDIDPPLRLGTIEVHGALRGRAEGWNWFLDDTRRIYGFGESLLSLSVAQHRSRFDWQLSFEQPTLIGLPDDAFLPGSQEPLGLGGTYFLANNRHRNPAGLFVSQAFLRIRGLAHNGDQLQLGRFAFSDGFERSSADPSLAWLKRERIAHRLIGDSYWTGSGRSMDGVHFSDDIGTRTNLTFVAARPTRGVYQTDGWGEMDVDLLYASFTRELSLRRSASEFRAFAIAYHDGRGVLKIDNRSLGARLADNHNIRIGSFGANYAVVRPIRNLGRFDLLTWGAVQIGSWGRLHHHAAAVTGEIGWQPPINWWRPWLRAGALSASADGNPNDNKHTTFFQILPTNRQYARLPFYSLQNLEDYMGQLLLNPSGRLSLRGEIHKVKLHGSNDLWYQGSGAFQNTSFGYEGRAPKAAGGLANFVDLSADFKATSSLDATAYVGVLSGKSTMTSHLKGRKAGFAYLEFLYRFW